MCMHDSVNVNLVNEEIQTYGINYIIYKLV